jgi:hypothetical protein
VTTGFTDRKHSLLNVEMMGGWKMQHQHSQVQYSDTVNLSTQLLLLPSVYVHEIRLHIIPIR